MSNTPVSTSLDFEALLCGAPDAIVIHDLLDQVLFWNEQAEQVYGWTAAAMQGRSLTGIFYLDSAAREKRWSS